MTPTVYDDRICELGEGPLWHPERKQLFWFDILGRRLLTREAGKPRVWHFPEMVSAAGWTGRDTLLIASERQLFEFNLVSGRAREVAALEADLPETRSNDGRADPHGGFWIGTMSKTAAPQAGAIYRYHKGTLRRIVKNVTIPNSICFDPGGALAYFSDTLTGRVMAQPLDAQGWPTGAPSVFLDLRDEGLHPDGAVTDSRGCLWVAQWGASRVASYTPEGAFRGAVGFQARHTSCPAFGGDALSTLYCTSAQEHLSEEILRDEPRNGMTFVAPTRTTGLPEPQVLL